MHYIGLLLLGLERIGARADSKGVRGIKPPYLPNINGYPLSPPSFLGRNYKEEGEKKKKRRGGRK